jgi:hypothetical protein
MQGAQFRPTSEWPLWAKRLIRSRPGQPPKEVAPSQGRQRQCARLPLLPPLGGVECFRTNRVPAVSLRSTAGCHISSLREPSFPGGCAL